MTTTEKVVAGVLICGGVGAGLLAGSARFIRRHVTAGLVSNASGVEEIDRETAHFAGQAPLREVRDGQPPVSHMLQSGSAVPGRTLRALVHDVRSGRIVHVDVPLAVLRVGKRSGFRYLGEFTPLLEDTEFETDRVDLSVEDVERAGRALLVDHAHVDGARILVWVE